MYTSSIYICCSLFSSFTPKMSELGHKAKHKSEPLTNETSSDTDEKQNPTSLHYPDPEPDIENFSQLHSWYKRLSFERDEICYPLPDVGKQKGQPIHKLTDVNTIHWHFVRDEYFELIKDKKLVSISEQFPIRISCHLYPSTYVDCGRPYNESLPKWPPSDRKKLWEWILLHYPDEYKQLMRQPDDSNQYGFNPTRIEICKSIGVKEREAQFHDMRNATYNMYNALLQAGYTQDMLMAALRANT